MIDETTSFLYQHFCGDLIIDHEMKIIATCATQILMS